MKVRRARNNRERSKHKLKGPAFPSIVKHAAPVVPNIAAGETKTQRYTFVPGTQGLRQQKRYLKHEVRNLVTSKDPIVLEATRVAIDRVTAAVWNEPDPEYSSLHLFHAAKRASKDTGEPWHVCMNFFMDEFDRRSKETDDAATDSETPAQRNQDGWFGSRLLRRVIARTFGS